jgi:hypothetical protein
LRNLCNFSIDKIVKDNCEKIIIFVSDNDSSGIRKAVDIYCGGLGIEPIVLRGRGHFLYKDMGTRSFPELLRKVLE